MTKLIMALGGAGLVALATVLAVALGSVGQPTTSVGTLTAPAGVSSPSGPSGATTSEDVSGPCDEAEHANDPRCTGATAPQPQAGDDGPNHDAADDHGDDDDQAEANDDHGDHGNEDSSGHGGGGDDDRGGSNSGRG